MSAFVILRTQRARVVVIVQAAPSLVDRLRFVAGLRDRAKGAALNPPDLISTLDTISLRTICLSLLAIRFAFAKRVED